MLSKIVISTSKSSQIEQVDKLLTSLKLDRTNHDLMWMESDSKSWGVKDIKEVKDHFLLKSESPKTVVIVEANKLTDDAQNALLKLIEETPGDGGLILTSDSENSLLSTILSRCELIQGSESGNQSPDYKEVEKFIKSNQKDRFILIEKLEDKEGFLNSLAQYISQQLANDPSLINLAQAILEGQRLAQSNGNIRALLEYIALS